MPFTVMDSKQDPAQDAHDTNGEPVDVLDESTIPIIVTYCGADVDAGVHVDDAEVDDELDAEVLNNLLKLVVVVNPCDVLPVTKDVECEVIAEVVERVTVVLDDVGCKGMLEVVGGVTAVLDDVGCAGLLRVVGRVTIVLDDVDCRALLEVEGRITVVLDDVGC